MLELYYNFFNKYCNENMFEELEMDTDSLYLALGAENLYDCIKPEKREEWLKIREKDCDDNFVADALSNFFPRTCCGKHIKHDNQAYSKKNSDVLKCIACVVRPTVATARTLIKLNLVAKV